MSMISHDKSKLISKTLLACNLSRSKNATPIASLEKGAKSICLLRISDWPLNLVSMSLEHPTIDDCRGVAICQFHLCT